MSNTTLNLINFMLIESCFSTHYCTIESMKSIKLIKLSHKTKLYSCDCVGYVGVAVVVNAVAVGSD